MRGGEPLPRREMTSAQPLLEEIVGVSHRPVVGLAEDFITELLVEERGLKAERLEEDIQASALDGELLGGRHQLAPVPSTAERLGHDENLDVQTPPPDGAEQTTAHLVASILERERDGRVVRQTGRRDVVRIQVVSHDLAERLRGVRDIDDPELGHDGPPGIAAGSAYQTR